MKLTIEFPRGKFEIRRNLNTAQIQVLVDRVMDDAERWKAIIRYKIEID